jgi:hypothetical protein
MRRQSAGSDQSDQVLDVPQIALHEVGLDGHCEPIQGALVCATASMRSGTVGRDCAPLARAPLIRQSVSRADGGAIAFVLRAASRRDCLGDDAMTGADPLHGLLASAFRSAPPIARLATSRAASGTGF